MGRHVALAVHPGSGRGAAARIANTVAARLRAEADQLEVITAESAEAFRARVERSRRAGLDALVVLGGDGAAHQAVQCCADSGPALGLVPCGTGNDLARALGVPADADAAVDSLIAALRGGTRRVVDLGRLDPDTTAPDTTTRDTTTAHGAVAHDTAPEG
ncbi:diacylglycerol/lipid kinase family protein, partial [Saccharomonospora saliphila]|uniref:diacylglycerol/lipid kinase family protein n=1 Tax=Saccharomonospora saliphila TaxID=369829 RepID=UPI00038294AF